MLIIVTYDVSTETAAGRKRLRRVAKACESMGQRVQKSVFECQVNEMQLEQLERTLLAEIDDKEDNLRFYRITEPVEVRVKQFGAFRSVDFEGPPGDMKREPQATTKSPGFRVSRNTLFFINLSHEEISEIPAGLAHGSGLAQACIVPQSKQSVMSAAHRPASRPGAD
jgi:CRISPR-associated protein Cas2